ncbi:helix-turn-helix domain-containing protein [Arthrobacter sp. AZCC_0090]|uniref:helix-turn-helix domain-containing protein n=1 Tax=Arthrobacter sp. AZCC_0090 TaxID=2735881 RepID=UPI0016134A7F|nr:helix-turn-helix domain-containing protein [Arthrobacter sp. AZCC_0090]MBB6403413.1 excisionase family DNA binding protein [Arthrobacter sp. AZCC_0090]
MNSEDEVRSLLNVRETAKLLGVHENTVRNWVKEGTLTSARVAGSRQHRFARAEVDRLLKSRGERTSSVAPALRTDGPELINAKDLDAWAARDDAKRAFPELIRRLLAVTPGITNVHVRAHEGVAAPGWDGTATSTGSTYLPAGELRFEFGTESNSKGKAQDDYDKRAKALPNDAESLFVFATPRNWAKGEKWAAERTAESNFAGVVAIDAHQLEAWLQASPSVHYWISERLGYRPRDAQTIERWWNLFQDRITIALPPEFFAAGRSAASDDLRTALIGAAQADSIVTLKAQWQDDALAFIFSTLATQEELLCRAIVVTDAAAWQRLVESPVPLILVPLFDGDPDLASAINGGHRVVLIAETDDVVRDGNGIELRKIDRVAAREALKAKATVPDSDEAERMVALARRSMAALIRSIALDPRFRKPDWADKTENAAILAPLVLAGTWSQHEGDLGVLEKLTGQSREEIERLLRSLSSRSDAPFVRSGDTWRLTSPVEAALLLLPRLTPSDLARWSEVVRDVLLEPDPFQGMDTVARLTASAMGTVPLHSGILKGGIAAGLALSAASHDGLPSHLQMQGRVDKIVHTLLAAANTDVSGETWARLAHALPALAEASPEVFLDEVERDLEQPAPVLRTMFQDQTHDVVFGPSSPHPSLLWALETLCWSPDHFGHSAMLLGKLSSIDPGGRLGNRPIASLQTLVTGWLPQSGATVDAKLGVIGRILQREPGVGWQLIMGVWPENYPTAVPPHSPEYRDWNPVRQSVTYTDWGRFVHELVGMALGATGTGTDRWMELLPKIGNLPVDERQAVIKRLGESVAANAWNEGERYAVWEVLTSEADKHEEYAETEWAMPAEDVAMLRAMAAELTPGKDARRFSNLFDYRPHLPNFKWGEDGYDVELCRLQNDALGDVLAIGADALTSLTLEVNTPFVIGRMLATRSDVPEGAILGWFNAEEQNLRHAALIFAGEKINAEGFSWVKAALANPALTEHSSQEALMAAVPFARKYWTEISTLGVELQAAYWQRANPHSVAAEERAEAIGLLVDHNRPWAALGLLSDMLHENQEPGVDLIKVVLKALRESPGPTHDITMSSYYLGNVLEYMEQHFPDDADLPGYEFFFFELLHDHHPSAALYRALGTEPSDFISMINALYRGEDEPKGSPTAQEKAFAHVSFSVLQHWHTLPGLAEDGTIDGPHLTAWVREARLAFADSKRAAIGDEQIGQVLASSPVGTDGVWPAEAVREIIENVGNSRLDTGLHIGKVNKRGVTSRGVFDGGVQERELEKHYREMATKISTQWPRTARVLRGIADSYQQDALRHDSAAERMSDDG